MRSVFLSILLSAIWPEIADGQKSLDGDHFTRQVQIKTDVFGDELQLTITPRLAGAVHSIQWRGNEFIDSHDHGRQLQSASNFDVGKPFSSETFNPTEAGSRSDGTGKFTTSKLMHLTHTENQLRTTVQMAFWLTPEQSSSGNPAKNKTRLSNHFLTKRITLGFKQWANVIRYEATFSTPDDEFHRYAQFEAVTGYMPASFDTFWGVDLDKKQITQLTEGPGEQALPVILAKADKSLAMGVFSPQQPSLGYETAGYGRFRFPAAQVTKWNSVFRVKNPAGIPSGDYYFDNYVVIGNLDQVRQTIIDLDRHFQEQP